jgi:predicted nucleic acid-binding protein
VIIDASAWVDYVRDSGRTSSIADRVETALHDGTAALTDPIAMEVLAGARDDAHLQRLRALLARPTLHAVQQEHWEMAAALYRACRQRGETVRKMLDCLIAAVAIDADLPVLHADRDFDVLARHTPLRVA